MNVFQLSDSRRFPRVLSPSTSPLALELCVADTAVAALVPAAADDDDADEDEADVPIRLRWMVHNGRLGWRQAWCRPSFSLGRR